jgi:hypothetical protein
MKRNFVIAAVVAAALSFAVGTVAAQDYFFPLFGAYVDHVVPNDPPCGSVAIRQIAPTVYEDTILLWYLCEDNRVVARRFFRSGGSSEAPKPVYLVPGPDSAPPPSAPAPTDLSCPAGTIPAIGGGCVPPDHPLAAR